MRFKVPKVANKHGTYSYFQDHLCRFQYKNGGIDLAQSNLFIAVYLKHQFPVDVDGQKEQ